MIHIFTDRHLKVYLVCHYFRKIYHIIRSKKNKFVNYYYSSNLPFPFLQVLAVTIPLNRLLMGSFLGWLRNRLISGGSEPVLSHTVKTFIASYLRQFSINIKIKIIKLIPALFARA